MILGRELGQVDLEGVGREGLNMIQVHCRKLYYILKFLNYYYYYIYNVYILYTYNICVYIHIFKHFVIFKAHPIHLLFK